MVVSGRLRVNTRKAASRGGRRGARRGARRRGATKRWREANLGSPVGFFDRFVSKSKRESKSARAARERENAGDLGSAADLYAQAGLGDDSARVLLLRADAERSVEKRIAFCALAAQRAETDEVRRLARGRKARVAFDTLRKSGGSFLESEVLTVARELEEAGDLERAADAYVLAGDHDAEVRVLTAAGAIERLEARLRESEQSTRSEREREQQLRRVTDLDRTAERREALELCRRALAQHDDPRIADVARAIRGRLLRGPVVDLEIDGDLRRYALGAAGTTGRGDSTIVIGSRAVSRRHVRIWREHGAAFVEDLDTRNGTLLAGARVAGPLRVGDGLRLVLGGEVPCAVLPVTLGADAEAPLGPVEIGCLAIEIAGGRYLAPLGTLAVDGWQVEVAAGSDGGAAASDESFVVLASPGAGARPYLGEFQLAARVELCHGDELRGARGGPVRLRVPTARGGAPGHDDTDFSRSHEP